MSIQDFDLKDRVRTAVDIVDVMGSTMELQPKGRNYVGLCPWHDDRRPSLTVNRERQTWKCWPCDIGGDVFSFVMRRDGVDFPTSVRILAEMAGIPIEEYQRGGKKSKPGSPDDRETLLNAVKLVCDAYFEQLDNPSTDDAKIARDYLGERGIDEENRRRFRIGFAPDSWSFAVDLLRKNGFNGEVATAASVGVARTSGSGHFDMFRGRLMFPIHDLQDRPISMGGRVIPKIAERYDDPAGKYINGRETLLFRKSQQLYGLSLAREAIRRQGEALVMEGYTDVVAARQAGIEPVVAVLGTALTAEHVKLLKRFTERVVLVLDGDDAGQRRSDEVLELFVTASVDLRVLTLPDGSDPADFVAEKGPQALVDLVREAPDALDHRLARLTEGVDVVRDTHAATSAVETMLGMLARTPQQDLRVDQMVSRLAQTFGVSSEKLDRRLEHLRGQQNRNQSQRRKPRPSVAESAPQHTFVDPNQAFAESAMPDDVFEHSAHSAAPSMPVSQSMGAPQDMGVTSEGSAPLMLQALSGIDRELFETLIENPELAAMAVEAIDPDWLDSNTAKMLLSAYQDLDLAGKSLDVPSLLLIIENEPLKNKVVTLESRVQERLEQVTVSSEERYTAIMSRYRDREFSAEKNRQIEQLESAVLPEVEEDALLKAMFDQEKARHKIDP